ncbi:MAG: hypothetical protein ACE5J5_00265 [Candidatus Hydrothermarchaeales archaeon]
MKDLVLSVINELKIASPDELFLILSDIEEDLKKNTLLKNLASLEKEGKIFRIKESEIKSGNESFVLGPVAEVEEDVDIKKQLLEKELFPQPLQLIKWDLVSRRIFTQLINDIEKLKEDILKQYKDSKALELSYFDLSLKYHEYYNYFHQFYSVEFLLPIHKLLIECRSYLDKLDF